MAKALRPHYCSRWKTAGEDQRIACRFCQGSVELMENLRRKTDLVPFGCFSARAKAALRTEKSRAFAINRASACCISPVKRLLLLQDDSWMIRCRKKITFLVFSERKFRKVKRTFLTPSRQPLSRFSWNLGSSLSDSFPWKPCRRFLFSFSVFK